jgi:hypothetical protein
MKAFVGFKGDGFCWFRIFGYGLHFKDITKHKLLFTERYGHTKYLKIGNWIIITLKKD